MQIANARASRRREVEGRERARTRFEKCLPSPLLVVSVTKGIAGVKVFGSSSTNSKACAGPPHRRGGGEDVCSAFSLSLFESFFPLQARLNKRICTRQYVVRRRTAGMSSGLCHQTIVLSSYDLRLLRIYAHSRQCADRTISRHLYWHSRGVVDSMKW